MPADESALDPSLGPHGERLAAQREFVRALARRLVAASDADDLAQDVLVAGLRHPPREPAALRGWLATATRHLASKWRRGEERRGRRDAAAATPEALPSTRELVERIELEQELVRAVLALPEPERTTVMLRFHERLTPAEIAARVGLPADTVRARLRRGLERLRGQLDVKYGARGWVASLLPIAGWKSLAEAAAAATTATTVATTTATTATTTTSGGLAAVGAAGVAAGATVMAVKSWLVGAAATALVVVGIGNGSTWLPPFLGGQARPALFARGGESALPSPALVAGAPATPAPAVAREAMADPAGDADAGSALPLPPPGSVKLRAVDRDTGAVIGDGVTVRFLSERRFAQHAGGGEIEVRLSGGRWTARVHARGYEPYDLGAFEVAADEPKDLGLIELARGSGVIEGDVVARHLAADAPVTIELRGHGRGRCAACMAPPADGAEDGAASSAAPPHGCGEGDEPTWFQLKGSRRFRFDSLAQGTYWLRAFDPQAHVVDARKIEVLRGGYVWAALEVSTPTLTRVELRHARGGRFHGDWSAFHAERTAPLEFEVEREGKVIARGTWQPSEDEVRETMGGPLVPLDGAVAAQAVAGDATALDVISADFLTSSQVAHDVSFSFTNYVRSDAVVWASQITDVPDADERDRAEGDSLEWDGSEPALEPAELKIEKTRPDAFTLSPLPRALLSVTVRCGGYESDPMPLDLRFGEVLPGVVALHATARRLEEFAWIDLPAPESCTQCHPQRRDTSGALQNWFRDDAETRETAGALPHDLSLEFTPQLSEVSAPPTPSDG